MHETKRFTIERDGGYELTVVGKTGHKQTLPGRKKRGEDGHFARYQEAEYRRAIRTAIEKHRLS